MATITRGKTFISGETVEPADMHQLVDSATVTGIVNADIASNAAIAASKLALTGAITDAQLAAGAVTGAPGGGKIAASAITSQTQKTSIVAADQFLIHSDSDAALRRIAWSVLQPAGTVLKTEYDDLIGVQSYTVGQTLATTTTSPTITSGVEILRIDGVATSSSSNYLIIDVSALVSSSAGGNTSGTVMLFAGSTLLASTLSATGSNNAAFIRILFKHSPGNTSGVNYTVRAAVQAGTLYVNRLYTLNDYNTGKQVSSMLIQEIKG